MKLKLIESRTNEVLFTNENCTDVSPYLKEYAQIYINRGNEIWVGKYLFNVIKVDTDEVDIYIEIQDTTRKE